MAIGAVMLCVTMVLVVQSVMGGWLETVKRQARGLLGDIIIDNRAYGGFPLYQEFLDEIRDWPEVEAATPVIYSWCLYHFPQTEQSGYARAVGIRLDEIVQVNAFGRSLYYERFYPGTTTLAPQGQPMLGRDLASPPALAPADDGDLPLEIYRPRLPEPYHSALERARARYHEQTGGILHDPDSVEMPYNIHFRRFGLPPIPGFYAFNDETGLPAIMGEPYPGLILGRDIIAQRESDGRYDRSLYPRGTRLTLTLAPTPLGGTVDAPVKQAFRYVDDSRTGIYDIDSQHVYCDFDLLQRLVEMHAVPRVDDDGNIVGTAPARCSQIQINVRDGVDFAALTPRLTALYHSFLDADSPYRKQLDFLDRQLVARISAMTWRESQASIIAPVEKEKILVTILFAIISLVAVALILCILYMIVLQKTRDIGIIKAIGGSSGGVAFIFVLYGAAVGVTGSVLGAVLGTLVVTYINHIQEFLIAVNPSWRVWDLKVYSFDRIPSEVSPYDTLVVVLIAIAAATIGSFAAAWRAGSMQPVEAIRHE